jgi:ribose transport system substrate-binding protein
MKGRWVSLVAVSLAAVVVAGCGSDDKSSAPAADSAATPAAETTAGAAAPSGVEEAGKRVEAARSVPTFPELAPPLDAAKFKGKKVFRISYDDRIPYEKIVGDGVVEGGKAAGVEVRQFDAKAQPAEAAKGIERAVSQGYDAIVIDNYSGEQLGAPIAAAKKAGVPVVINNETSGSLPPSNADVAGTQGFDYVRTAALEADWVIQDSKGKANVLVFGAAGVPGSGLMLDSMKKEFGELCPDCKVNYKEVPVANWQSQLPSLTGTELNRDRKIDYIIAIWDGMVFGIAPGVRNAAASDRVKIVTSNGTPAIMEMLAKGDMVAAEISDPMQWLGWAAFDQAMRVQDGGKPIDHKITSRLFDEKNIGDIDVKAGVPEWYNHVYETGYKALWGLS